MIALGSLTFVREKTDLLFIRIFQYSIPDPKRFIVTLRHGALGIETLLRYFGHAGGFNKKTTNGEVPYIELPKQLNILFQETRKRYYLETSKTHESILKFLTELKAAYDQPRFVHTGRQKEENAQFSLPISKLLLRIGKPAISIN